MDFIAEWVESTTTMAEMGRYVAMLDAVLEEAVAATLEQAGGAVHALLYSAGVDSALLAKLCQDAGYAPLLLSLGTVRSKDREFVDRSRPYLDLPIQFITVGEDDIAEALPAVRDLCTSQELLFTSRTSRSARYSSGP